MYDIKYNKIKLAISTKCISTQFKIHSEYWIKYAKNSIVSLSNKLRPKLKISLVLCHRNILRFTKSKTMFQYKLRNGDIINSLFHFPNHFSIQEQWINLSGEVDWAEPGDHQLRQHHVGHAHHLPVRHHGGLDPYHVLGEKIIYYNLVYFAISDQFHQLLLFHFFSVVFFLMIYRLIVFCAFPYKKLVDVLATLAKKQRTPKVSQIVSFSLEFQIHLEVANIFVLS